MINENNAEIHLSSISETSSSTSASLPAEELKDLFFSHPPLPKDCEGQWIDNYSLSLSCPEAVRISAESGNFWLRKSVISWDLTFQIFGSFDVMVCSVNPNQCTSTRESIVVLSTCDDEMLDNVEEEKQNNTKKESVLSSVALGSSFVAVVAMLTYLYLFHVADKTTTKEKSEDDVVVKKKKEEVDIISDQGKKIDDGVLVKQEKKIDDDLTKIDEDEEEKRVDEDEEEKRVDEDEDIKEKKVDEEDKENKFNDDDDDDKETLKTPPKSISKDNNKIEPTPGRLSRLFSTPTEEDQNAVRRRLRVELQKKGYALEPTNEEIEKSPVLKRRQALEMKLKERGYEL